jgi:alcohol dehydrogenase class IV
VKSFEFSYGPKLISGAGSVRRLAELLPPGRCLFVTDRKLRELKPVDAALAALDRSEDRALAIS